MTEWTREDSAAATREGWDIFDNSDHGLRIEHIDSPEDGSSPAFESDQDAFEHVAARAAAGSRLHFKALAIHGWMA